MSTGIGGIAGATEFADAPAEPSTGPSAAARRSRNGRYGRWLILLVAAIYFLGPLVAAIAFTLKGDRGGISFKAYGDIFTTSNGQTGIGGALLYSLLISAVAIAITLGLMLPTQLLIHLRLPRWRPLVETLTLLPLVFPPIVLVVGVSGVYAWAAPPTGAAAGTHESIIFHILKFLREDSHPLLLALLYVILAMPFTFRALDSGIRAIDAQTLVEAARNLGAGWGTVLFQVLVPCLRTALVNAAFLCFALVMGEYTISSILLYTKPFPVWLAQLPTTSGQVQAALSVFSLLLVEVILLVLGALNVRGPASRKE
jgi:putative spermidine/putrescine transport system permease protein